jgi:LL-diaminopimelate aminotransferase
MEHIKATKLKRLPPYLFAEIDRMKQEALQRGQSLISLGIGDPDLPTPQVIIQAMKAALDNPENHQYPSYQGKLAFREAIQDWCARRFGLQLNPQDEILPLIGSKEGIAHLPFALLNPGERAWIPNPGYPVYETAVLLAGGIPVPLPLKAETHYLSPFSDLSALVRKEGSPKLWFMNYPMNPTAATVPLSYLEEAVAFAKKHHILIIQDMAYSEIYLQNQKPPSILEIPGAKDVAIEFHSLSKTFNMTGWRTGFVIGNPHALAALLQFKTHIDSGIFGALQDAATEALKQPLESLDPLRGIYRERCHVLLPALKQKGFNPLAPDATFYIWCHVGGSSMEIVSSLIQNCGIIATPGVGFGSMGEGFVRFTLCHSLDTLGTVVHRLSQWTQPG